MKYTLEIEGENKKKHLFNIISIPILRSNDKTIINISHCD